MFGNAIVPPLTFNSSEEPAGQGASLCDKQTPAGAGLARVRRGRGTGINTTAGWTTHPMSVTGRPSLQVGRAFFPHLRPVSNGGDI